jgi:hypothetical protein
VKSAVAANLIFPERAAITGTVLTKAKTDGSDLLIPGDISSSILDMSPLNEHRANSAYDFE